MMEIQLLGEKVRLSFGTYTNGQTYIQAWSDEGPFATCTVAVERPEAVPEGYITVPEYKCPGLVDGLVKAGIIEQPTEYIAQGWVSIPVCKLKIDAPTS
jgi:hypothetical protein